MYTQDWVERQTKESYNRWMSRHNSDIRFAFYLLTTSILIIMGVMLFFHEIRLWVFFVTLLIFSMVLYLIRPKKEKEEPCPDSQSSSGSS